MTTIILRNITNKEFIDVSSEKYRIYCFGEYDIQIENPQWLNVSESGGHRILDLNGISYYIPSGWICLKWEAKEFAPHFVA